MFSKKNHRRSHHGILIFVIMLFGITFEPGFPKEISSTENTIIASIMFLLLLSLVVMVRKVTNQEKLFSSRLKLSKVQIVMFLILVGYSIYLYVSNDNISGLVELLHQPLNIIISCTFVALGAGFFEEYFVRGYLFNLTQRILDYYHIKRNRMIIIVLITSFIFGLGHLTNLTGGNLLAVSQQVFYTFCLGVVFGIFRIITNCIWIVAFMHFIYDYDLYVINAIDSSSWLDTLIPFSIALILGLLFLVSINKSIDQNSIQEIEP